MDFQEALQKKHLSTFKSVKEQAKNIGMSKAWLDDCLNGRGRPSEDMKRVLYNYYRLWEYGVEL